MYNLVTFRGHNRYAPPSEIWQWFVQAFRISSLCCRKPTRGRRIFGSCGEKSGVVVRLQPRTMSALIAVPAVQWLALGTLQSGNTGPTRSEWTVINTSCVLSTIHQWRHHRTIIMECPSKGPPSTAYRGVCHGVSVSRLVFFSGVCRLCVL